MLDMMKIVQPHPSDDPEIVAEALRRFGPNPYPKSDDPEFADCPDYFWEHACEWMIACEREWKRTGQVFSWIDEQPDWLSLSDWHYRAGVLDPDKPCTRTFRLALIGGGHIKVSEDFVSMYSANDKPPTSLEAKDMICYEPRLQVQAVIDNELKRTFRGVLSHGAVCEMSAHAALFPKGTPQDIADRTAATLRLISKDNRGAENFAALLAHSTGCGSCGRPLKDEVSKMIGIGPTCASLLGIKHNIENANRVLARRRELLGA